MNKRTDIWAFGCVLYEMLTGRRAFAGDEVSEVLASVLAREPDWTLLPAGLSPMLSIWLKRCLHKDPKERLGDAQSMRLALEGAFETTTVASAMPPVTHLQLDVMPADRLTSSPDSILLRPTRTAMALSPDGRLVVFAGMRGTVTQLYARSLDQVEARPIPGTEGASEPIFSPNGESIGFTADNKIRRIPAAGGPPATICDLPPLGRGAGKSWGEDGTIFFAGPAGIAKVSSAGGRPVMVTTPDAGERHVLPHSLPGGKGLLFTAVTADITVSDWETSNIVLHSLDTGEQRVLIAGAADARYVRTGHLAYMKTGYVDGRTVRRSVAAGDRRTRSSDREGDARRERAKRQRRNRSGTIALSTTGTLLYVEGGIGPILQRSLVWVDRTGVAQPPAAPAWLYAGPRLSPDGQKIAVFANRGATRTNDVWVCDMLRGAPIRLTVEANNTWPIWSPDGKRLAYASSISGVSNLYAINADRHRHT